MAYSLPGPLGLARDGFEVLYVEMNHWINLLDCITVVEFTSIKVANVYGSFSSVCVCVRARNFPHVDLSTMETFLRVNLL